MGFFNFLVKDVETHDNSTNKDLLTHYYHCEYRKAKEVLLDYFKASQYHVKNIDDKYGEILVENSNFHMIVSIRREKVINVSIDVKVNVYRILALNKPYKIVNELYNYMDKHLSHM